MARDAEPPEPGGEWAAGPREEAAHPLLDGPLREAIERWEALPHNREGSDKSWVERLLRQARRHFGEARRTG